MLRSQDKDQGLSVYQSVALSVVSSFSVDRDIISNAAILFNLPIFIDIISDADNPIYEDSLLVIFDAYTCLRAIIATEKGRMAFIGNRGIHFLCNILDTETFQCEDALELLTSVLTEEGEKCWGYHSATEDFHKIMNKFSSQLGQLSSLQVQICKK